MTNTPVTALIDRVRRIALHTGDCGPLDGELLEAFISCRDETAFEAIVRRHGPMVLGVCRRVLGNDEDAEDAFQATFLVLARKAATIKPRHMVGNWLYGVAHRTALEARAVRHTYFARQRRLADHLRTQTPCPEPDGEWRQVLDEELLRLPDHYRVVVILCDLEGKTQKDVSRHLECPPGTVACRLVRGRALLAKRLARRGIVVAGGTLATLMSSTLASASIPSALIESTVKAATAFAAGNVAVTASALARPSVILAQGVLKMMFYRKLGYAALALTVALLVSTAGASLIPWARAGAPSALTVESQRASPECVVVQESNTAAKVVVAIYSGGDEGDLKEIGAVLGKIPAIKVKTESIALSDIRREGKVFTKFLPIEMTDTSKTDIGAIAKTVASAKTPSKDRVPPGLYLIIGFEAGGARNEQLRQSLENVKGVEAKHSWAGDVNLWVSVDGSGQAKIADITKALKDVGIPLKN